MLMKNKKVSSTPNKLGINSLLQDLVASNNANLRSTLSPSQPFIREPCHATLGEERCVTTLITAAKETKKYQEQRQRKSNKGKLTV